MTGTDTADDSRLTGRQRAAFALAAVVCILLAGTALVVAQGTGYSEDWESGTLDGYTVSSDASTFSEVNDTNPSNGTYSLYQEIENSSFAEGIETQVTLDGDTAINFSDGTILTYDLDADLDNQFDGGSQAETVFTEVVILGGEGDDLRMRFGANLERSSSGFRMQGSAVGTSSGSQSGESVDTNGYSTVELVYVESSDEVELYVDDTLESTQDFNGFQDPENATFQYRTRVVSGSGSAYVYYDNVTAAGVENDPTPDSDELRLDVRGFMHHDTEQPYTVEANQSGTWVDVTDSSTVTSGNTSVITVNDSRQVLNATADESVNERVTITATNGDLNATANVTVATPTVDNLDILPTWWKVNAVLGDWALIWIMAGTLAGVFGGRASTAFAGVAAFFMFMIGGWLMGDVPHGTFLIALFTVLFAGMNLALNIDYTIQQT